MIIAVNRVLPIYGVSSVQEDGQAHCVALQL
jgi:hypothetical protein